MSSTNKTTNYKLSQFVGSDKPAWLTDYNQDMAKIDAGIDAAQDAATGADVKADANTANIGDMSYLSTTAKNTLVAAINEIDSNTDAAANTASAAATNANAAQTTANTAVEGLQRFNLTNRTTHTVSANKGSLDTKNTLVQTAIDNTNSIFKIYGRVNINNLNGQTGSFRINLAQTSLRPSQTYTINTSALVYRLWSNGSSDVVPRNITVDANGSLYIEDNLSGNVSSYIVMIPPCLYFNVDFGDE